MSKNFFKSLLFKEHNRKTRDCPYGSKLCNKRLSCDKCKKVLIKFVELKFVYGVGVVVVKD